MALIHLKVGNADDPEFLKLGNMMTPVLGNGGDPGAFLSGELGWPLTCFGLHGFKVEVSNHDNRIHFYSSNNYRKLSFILSQKEEPQ